MSYNLHGADAVADDLNHACREISEARRRDEAGALSFAERVANRNAVPTEPSPPAGGGALVEAVTAPMSTRRRISSPTSRSEAGCA